VSRHAGTILAAAALCVTMSAIRATAQGGGAQGGAPTSPAQPATKLSNAADSALDARTSEVAAGLRCPVCQGLSIQASPSELSQQMRAVVKEQLAAGKTPDEVRAYFVSKYGEWILLAPKASGFNLVAYLLPPFLLICGIAGIGVLVRRWTAAGAAVDGAAVDGVAPAEDPPED
jgi:cytochrome c-type biogenesis protein CcmH